MHLLAWVRLMVARHPWIYWLAIVAVAGVAAVGSASALAGVDAARRSWGEQSTVWMTTSAIEPGQSIAATRARRSHRSGAGWGRPRGSRRRDRPATNRTR